MYPTKNQTKKDFYNEEKKIFFLQELLEKNLFKLQKNFKTAKILCIVILIKKAFL